MIKNEHISRYIGILANRLRREIDALALCGEYSGAEAVSYTHLTPRWNSKTPQILMRTLFQWNGVFSFVKI